MMMMTMTMGSNYSNVKMKSRNNNNKNECRDAFYDSDNGYNEWWIQLWGQPYPDPSSDEELKGGGETVGGDAKTTAEGEVCKWSQRGQPEKEHEVRQSEGEKMEVIPGPGTEIKAVLHEINGGLHKQYMNHSLPLQWERQREWDGSRQRENRAAGSLTTTSKVSPFSKKLHNTSGKVTGGEEGGRRRGWEKSYRCAGEQGK